MRKIITLLMAVMAFIGVVAQAETSSKGPIARVEPEEMHLTCLVGETVVDTFYVYNLSSSSVYPVSGFTSEHGYIWTESIHESIPPGGVAKGIVTYTPEQAGSHRASLSMNIGGEIYGVDFYGVATEPTEQTDMPIITYTYDDEYYIVTAYGDGEVKLYYEGELVDNPYTLPRTQEGYIAIFSATAKEPGKRISETTYTEVYVEPVELYYLPTPVLIVEQMSDDTYYIYAGGSEGEIHLMVNGGEVQIPFVVVAGEEEQVLICEAYATADENNPTALESEHVVRTVVIPARPVQPIDKTSAPVFSGAMMVGGSGYTVEIFNTDSDWAEIYYRVFVKNGDEWDTPSEWMTYEAALAFTQIGKYRVEAYAIAPGKAESSHVAYEFTVYEATDWYDFEENGIFYNIIDERSVSVTSKNNLFNSYTGEVSIPNTVTHDGVTYMVTAIGENAFNYCNGLTAVTIGDYVTAIGAKAFQSCSNLTSIVLGDYVITVADEAFRSCSKLASVTLGKGLSSLGNNAFAYCRSITDVTCKAATPPAMAHSTIFDRSVYQSATLHVYPPVLKSYENADYWNNFVTIVGDSTVSPKPNDINGDGDVNVSDITTLINNLLNAH